MQKLLIILISVIVLCVVLRLGISWLSTNRVATGLTQSQTKQPTLDGCSDLHNCTSSTATVERNAVKPIDYETSADTVIKTIAGIIQSQAGATIITQNAIYLHATYKTPLLGYTDDLELLLDNTDGLLHIRSASRIGKSDLGANRKRIEALRKMLHGKI